VGRTVEGWILP